MRTLKSFLEVYKPKAGDEQKFVDKHVTIKHQDRNEVNGKSNGDDVFNASNVKTVNRKANRQGYDAGDDEKVYEEVEDLDENAKIVAHLQKRYGDNIRKSHVMSAAKDFGVDASKLTKAVRTKLGKTMLDEEDSEEPPFAGPYDKPGARKDRFGNLVKNKNVPKFLAHKAMRDLEKKKTNEEVEEEEIAALLDEALDLLEKTLTPAELKKREEIAQAMERENPGMPMSKKMAIATAQAKKVAEEVEQIDEVKNMTTDKLKSLVARGDSDSEGMSPAFGMQIKAARNELARRKKMGMKEEAEQIDELSKKTLASYAKKAAYQASSKGVTGGLQLSRGSHIGDSEEEKKGIKNISLAYKRSTGARKAIDKLTKEDIISRAVDKYVPEELKYTAEQRLVNRISELPESHINTILDLFHSLSENNQRVMIESVETTEGLNKVLDFAISNRGA